MVKRQSVQICLGFLLLFFLAGCGEEGTNAYALWNRRSHPDGHFRLFFPAPPWTAASNTTDAHPKLELNPLSYEPAQGPQAQMTAEAWWDADTSPEAMLRRRQGYWQDQGCGFADSGEQRNAHYQSGLFLQMTGCSEWVKEVYFSASGGTAVLSMRGRDASYSADVDLMLDGFGPLKE